MTHNINVVREELAQEEMVLVDPDRIRTAVPQWMNDASIATVNPFGKRPSKSTCDERPTQTLMLAGSGQTNRNGEWQVELLDITCAYDPDAGNNVFVFTDTPLFVATVRGSTPRLLTVTTSQSLITVRSWTLDGSPTSNVPFFWHCVGTGAERVG
jgi:hypothetical protein